MHKSPHQKSLPGGIYFIFDNFLEVKESMNKLPQHKSLSDFIFNKFLEIEISMNKLPHQKSLPEGCLPLSLPLPLPLCCCFCPPLCCCFWLVVLLLCVLCVDWGPGPGTWDPEDGLGRWITYLYIYI